mgnify:CR=1 FL=1
MQRLADGTASSAILLELGWEVARQAGKNLEPHRKTGTLERSIRPANVDVGAQSVQVRAGGTRAGNYAQFLEFGTGVYGPKRRPIVPVRAKFLRFPAAGADVRLSGNLTKAQQRAGGGWQFRRSVKGVQPIRYMSRAVTTVSRAAGLRDKLVAEWNKGA